MFLGNSASIFLMEDVSYATTFKRVPWTALKLNVILKISQYGIRHNHALFFNIDLDLSRQSQNIKTSSLVSYWSSLCSKYNSESLK